MKTGFKAAIAALVACAGAAFAQQPGNAVETKLEARKVVTAADGKEGFAGAEQARPGDVIEYAATYRNTTRQPVKNLQATLPIPANTELVTGSQKPADARASLDGRAFESMPLRRKVTRDGVQVEETVPAREYRALRWIAPELGGEKSMTFTARVRVIDDRTTGPPPVGQGTGK